MEYVTASNKFKSPRQRVFFAGMIAWLIVRATVFVYFAAPHAHTWDMGLLSVQAETQTRTGLFFVRV